MRLVKLCDRMIRDHGGKRHTKTGRNQATLPEIAAVIYIRSGETRIIKNRSDYNTMVNPDHSIDVVEKFGKSPRMYHASSQELNNYFVRQFGPKYANVGASDEFQNVNTGQQPDYSANNTSEYAQQIISQDNSKITKTISDLAKIVTVIAFITKTLGEIKVGPAVDNIKEAGKAVGGFNKFVLKQIKNLQKIIQKRRAAKK